MTATKIYHGQPGTVAEIAHSGSSTVQIVSFTVCNPTTIAHRLSAWISDDGTATDSNLVLNAETIQPGTTVGVDVMVAHSIAATEVLMLQASGDLTVRISAE